MKRSLSLVLLLLTAACASVTQAPPAQPVHLVVVGTTDVHGWFNGHVETPPEGGKGVLWGGLPTFASYVAALRAEEPGRVIVVDSGDMFQGTLESNMFEGEAVVKSYNAIGYAAAAVGNHEFDFGPVGPAAIARAPGEDALGALKRNARLARFPLLSANMVEKSNGRTPSWVKRYTIVEAGGAKLGIIGLTTPDTPNVTMAANVVSLQFTDPVAATIAAASELRAKGADAIIVIAHMGGRCKRVDDPYALDSCNADEEAMQFLEKLRKGTIDGFFAGHTHAEMRHIVNGVPALEAKPFSDAFSTLDLWIDTQHDRVTRSEMRPHTAICTFVYEGTQSCDPHHAPADAQLVPRIFDGKPIHPDKQVVQLIEPYLRRVAAKRDERIGVRATAHFNRSYSAESPLGDLLADALREYAVTDFAFMNSGGIRADLPAGNVNYGQIFAVSPFDNFPAIVRMTGAQIRETLRLTSTGARGIMQVSGLRYTIDEAIDADKPAEERNRLVSVTLADGSALDPQKVYSVAMPDFIAAGGDGTLPVMKTIPPADVSISYLKPVRDVLVDVLERHGPEIDPRTSDRITVLNEVK